MAFKLLKRRYRSSEDDEKLRRLDFFHHPYEQGNTIRLLDDIDLPKSISTYSLSTQFVALEESKRGKKNATEREDNKKNKNDDYEPFQFDKFEN